MRNTTTRLTSATRLLTAAIVVSLAAAGCGSDSEESAEGTGSSTANAAKATDDPSEEAGTRTIATSRGDVEVPTNPKKIVILGEQLAGMMKALDVDYQALGAYYGTEAEFSTCYPWMTDSAAPKIKPELVSQMQVNVEAVAAEKPDLIISVPYLATDDKAYEQLSAIAPVVLPKDPAMNPDWNKILDTVAEAVGKPDESGNIVKDLESKYAAIKEEYPSVKGKTYQFFRAGDDGYMMGNGSPMKLIGMEAGEYHTDEHQNKTTFSWEKMGDLQADLIAVYDPTEQWWDKLNKDARFKELPAVQKGNAYVTDLAAACAINNSDPIGLEWFLDNRVKKYAKKLDETSN